MRFTGLEITVYEADGTIVATPVYEAHTVSRAIEIIDATKRLMTDGRTFTFRTL